MSQQTDKPHVKREIRLPLYVHVRTQFPLRYCHSVNISFSGIGLIANVQDDADCPAEGDEVDVTFILPDSDIGVQARGKVMWRHQDFTVAGGGGAIALGVAFHHVADPGRIELTRYLRGYRFHVGVVSASPAERAAVRTALKDHGHLHFAEALPEAESLLRRGDVSVMIICGRDEALATALVDRVSAGISTSHFADGESGGLLPDDLAPRIIYCVESAPDLLVDLFNRARIFRSIAPPLRPDRVRQVAILAFGDYGVRTEYRRVALALERALLRERARKAPRSKPGADARVVYESEAMGRVLKLAGLVAPYKAAVLLQGETGTGKEVVARVIHESSERANGVFVVQDCGALTETLLESELFGHVKGSFTGAIVDHMGLFAIAEGGTIFLDEIENTTPKLQAKLLRVIETGEVRPVGGAQVRYVDVRVIAASNRDLNEEVRDGRFRPDLFYRLNMFPIVLPPLRDRPLDILPLTRHFLKVTGANLGKSPGGLSEATEKVLGAYHWPGNVRELRNVVERAVILSRPGQPISPAQLPEGMLVGAAQAHAVAEPAGSLKGSIARLERELIRAALGRNNGVLRQTAAELGTSAATLSRKIRQHGL